MRDDGWSYSTDPEGAQLKLALRGTEKAQSTI
jgi:hypothetical protein